MFYIEPSSKDISMALDSWKWLPLGPKHPILVTAFGDIFLSAPDGIWFLDTLEGNLNRVCDTREELTEILQTEDGENHYLFAGFVERAHREGMLLQADECYDFKINPVVGGAIEFDNLEPRNFAVAVNMAGQLHEQTRNMPEGARISGFTIDSES
ncbi:MAG: T6SS immunity protein Tdi1 domain-containing protein [Verrucomicrobiales bacterium]